ncbi:MAG TPA: Ig-like domain-containing protein [Candidatus Krumholzibacteria bacterium]|nr:Ig-like domain-containing protein [Candidatus Krumholzibacteria bacterium]HPD71897.1 Ig-like domain-containing protein [Candidatus Krumholzibacteria bacterium]HRY41170.1 Ig-like domain-containing protein [Candidatus Krumholzibacteria bacterium]
MEGLGLRTARLLREPTLAAVVVAALGLSLAPIDSSASPPLESGNPEPPAAGVLRLTSTADFAAGTFDGAGVSEVDSTATGGQLRLAARFSDLFLAPTLDPQWHVTRPSAGFAPLIAGGILDVQERDDDTYLTSALETWATWDAGVVCEVRAMVLPGSAFVNLGFTSSTSETGQWAFFSTRGTGNQQVPVIKASVRAEAGGTVDVPTSATFGEWHVFRIEWMPSRLSFFVDGALADERTGVELTLPQRVALYKSDASASPLLVDWVRVTPYAGSPGRHESAILDAGAAGTPWTTLAWDGESPVGTGVAFQTRTGETPTPGSGWSSWSAPAGGAITSPHGRYLQCRSTLTTTDLDRSPLIDEIRVGYTYPDVTRPVVVATSPPDGAAQVPVGAAVTATFDEAIDPATLTDASFRLDRTGGGAVAATLDYDPVSFTATLAPDAPLDPETGYEARLTTDVADGDGNGLAAAVTWSFTTAPADETPPAVLATVPAAGAAGVLANRTLSATFSEAIDPASLTAESFTVAPLGGSPVDATVTWDPAGLRAILDPAASLDWGAVHEVRLADTIRDPAGNELGTPGSWTFSTRLVAPAVATATSAADFTAGDRTDLAVTEMDHGPGGGQLRLPGQLNDLFREPTLGPEWHATNPEGYTPVIADGILDVQERNDATFELSSIESDQTWGPGVVLEARAMFIPGSRFIDVGFDATTNGNTQYAWFSTGGTGDQPGNERIYARYREWDHNTIALETTATYNEWHVFKIIWTHGHLQFFVDGVLEAEASNVLIIAPLHAAFYKSAYSDTPFYIDWIRVTPYTAAAGTYVSPVIDSGEPALDWYDLEWSGLLPAATSVLFETRTGETPAPGASWSAWAPLDGIAVASPPGRYAQYRAFLASDDPLASPVIDEIHLSRDGILDAIAPAVTTTSPAADAQNVAIDAQVTATFTEPLDRATLTSASFTLAPAGRAAVPAAVTWDPTRWMAILTPAEALEATALYEACLTTAVTDTADNALLGGYCWTFTTGTSFGAGVPEATRLGPNVPNPFNPQTRMTFDVGQSDEVRLAIYGLDGRLVRTLFSGRLGRGRHTADWDGLDDAGREVAAGAYVARLETSHVARSRKMTLLR